MLLIQMIVSSLVQLAKDTFGGVDVIFLNAGLMPNSPLSQLKTGEWNSMVDVNIKGVLNGIAAVLPTFTVTEVWTHHHYFISSWA